MKIIGITGGVGSGKSRVLSYLEEQFDAIICQADHVAWELQEPGQKCYIEIVEYYGKDILHGDGTIDRKKLGRIVFANPEELLVLNRIMHPTVKDEIMNRICNARKNGITYFFLEAALLLEDAYKQICDEMWYIYADEITRRIRLRESRAYTDEKIDSIMASQPSEKIFRKECQIVIDNSGKFEDTCYQIDEAMKQE